MPKRKRTTSDFVDVPNLVQMGMTITQRWDSGKRPLDEARCARFASWLKQKEDALLVRMANISTESHWDLHPEFYYSLATEIRRRNLHERPAA